MKTPEANAFRGFLFLPAGGKILSFGAVVLKYASFITPCGFSPHRFLPKMSCRLLTNGTVLRMVLIKRYADDDQQGTV